jgi:hypothetical protein
MGGPVWGVNMGGWRVSEEKNNNQIIIIITFNKYII